MEEHQNKQLSAVGHPGSQEELCHIWDLTLASTVDILYKWQDQPQWRGVGGPLLNMQNSFLCHHEHFINIPIKQALAC